VKRAWIRWGRRVALAVIALYAVLVGWVVQVSRDDQRRAADVIVVLGAAHYGGRPSPVLRARLEHALVLFHERLAPRVLVTGGTHPGDRESEAKVQRRYLLERLVPESLVTALGDGASTEESMTAVSRWVHEHGLSSALLVSDGFHLCRLRLEAKRVELTAFTSPAPASPIQSGSRREWAYFALEALKVPVALVKSWFHEK
jgi:uncharacterized SAM-binding protein YcdF (DUF218 family)